MASPHPIKVPVEVYECVLGGELVDDFLYTEHFVTNLESKSPRRGSHQKW